MSDTANEAYVLRKYTPDDKAGMIELYEKVWGREKAKKISSIWEWKYHENPFGEKGEYQSLLVEKGNKIIAFLGAFPARLKVGDIIYNGVWLGDFMSDPQYRGASAGVRLSRTIINKVPVLIGHADSGDQEGAIAYRMWKKIKKSKIEITEIPNLTKRISVRDALYERTKIKIVSNAIDSIRHYFDSYSLKRLCRSCQGSIEISELTRFSDHHKPFLDDLMVENPNIPVKSVEYLNWRFFERPLTTYTVLLSFLEKRPVGYIVFRTIEEDGKINGRIVDFLVKKEEKGAAFSLLNASIERLKRDGARIVRTYGTNSENTQDALEAAHFSSKSMSVPKTVMIGQCPDESFFNSEDWYFSFSDGDFEMD